MSRNARYLLFLLLFNTGVAAVLTTLGRDRSFAVELIYSHFIGMSCGLPALAVVNYARSVQQLRIGLMGSIVGGVMVGVALAAMFTAGMAAGHTVSPRNALVVGIVFALVAGYFFYTTEGTQRLENELRRHQRQRAEFDRAQAAMQLRLLQSQVEPHFLFNTLAHLAALIRTDPVQAEQLLSHLNGFLRAALRRNRQDRTTLRDELALVNDYLSIVAVRLGDRLKWSMEVEPGLESLAFPFMLVQPLVENAIQHGIEPKRGGGELTLRVWRDGRRLRLRVRDTGVGMDPSASSGGGGVGLSNARQRLQALYGSSASLVIRSLPSGGVCAELDLPT